MEIGNLHNSKFFSVTIHVLIWFFIFLVPLIFIEDPVARRHFMIFGWYFFLIIAAYFYLNYLILIPRFLLRKKIFLFILFLVLGWITIGLIDIAYHYIYFNCFFIKRPHPPYYKFLIFTIYPALFALAVSLSIRITGYWLKAEKQKKEMENEKLISELAFLKSQINPHFLFNVLNNICSLARKKSDDTENAIIKLAQIMRYMLSDSKNEKVGLEKEVEYLNNYIELQKLRISDKVDIQFQIEGSPDSKMIEPLLLIPFVENAFKYGISYLEDSGIYIGLRILEDRLFFSVENKIRKKEPSMPVESGIGLKNVIRRLDLLYPGQHKLTIQDNGENYIVNLEIKIKE
ncbi:MAG: histidine kinase [Bacteroidota bacterium]|nr:histidine kinase [Bacteroidota bacterium]